MSSIKKVKANSIYRYTNHKKRKRAKTDKRDKGDFFTERQMQIFREVEKLSNDKLMRDLKKFGHWIDIADSKHNIAITIKLNNEDYSDFERILYNNGWNVVYVSYHYMDNKSIEDAIEKIKFLRNKRVFIKDRAEELESSLPKSEHWYREKIQKESFYDQMKFEFNKPLFSNFIFDLYSDKYRLCIEVDGSIHNVPEVKIKDRRKTYITKRRGFNIIRVTAFDEESYKRSIELIKEHITNYTNPGRLNMAEEIRFTSEGLQKNKKLPF